MVGSGPFFSRARAKPRTVDYDELAYCLARLLLYEARYIATTRPAVPTVRSTGGLTKVCH